MKDATGKSIADVYGGESNADADIAKVLTLDEARRVAANIARSPKLLALGGVRGAYRPDEETDLTAMALQTPEQTPEGPLPVHVPLPRNLLNRPVPWAIRGPATAFIRACPKAEMRPST